MNIIKREKYLHKIEPFIEKEIIKVLIGGRRTGKTYLLLQIIEHIKNNNPDANIIYINKEDPEHRGITNNLELFDYVKAKTAAKKKNYVFIDEIQEIKQFETALRELFYKGYDIYCTGSNAYLLSSDIATYLSGRYIEIPVYSLSFNEFLTFHRLEKSNDSLLKYIKYGGLPYLIHLPLEDEIVYQYHVNIYNTIVLKDIVMRFNVREVDFLGRLIEYLCENTGSYVSSNRITEFLKSQRLRLSINTVQSYLQYLTDSFLVDKVKRYDIKGKKVFEMNEKFYFRDLGIKHAIIPYKPDAIGKVIENLIYNKLVMDGYSVNTGKLNNKEIDFIAQKKNETIYIQAAYQLSDQKVFEREFGNLLEISDNYKKMVVAADELADGNYKGIEYENILDFLVG